MKKIYAPKPNTPVVPPHRSFRRFVNQLFDHILKRQPQGGLENLPDELMQQLKKMERKIDAYMRALERQARQK